MKIILLMGGFEIMIILGMKMEMKKVIYNIIYIIIVFKLK